MTGSWTAAVIAVVAGYLVGSIPVAVLVCARHGIDPRAVGDGNPGYWNVKELLGRRAALPVIVGDTAKGLAAGSVGILLAGSIWGIGYAAVAAAMIGHAYPVFAGFRGGRSILTFAGGLLAVSSVAALIAVGLCAAVSLLSGRFDIGARVGVFGFPFVQLFLEPAHRVAATGALMCIIGLRFVLAAVAERRGSTPQ